MGKNKVFPIIDGQCDEKNIADRFATVFSSACVPNSETGHAELSRFTAYDYTDACTNRISRELF